MNYTVTEAVTITPSTVLVTLQHTGGHPMVFRPGQYAAIHGYVYGRPMPIRCFSIVSSPTQADTLQFSMRVRGKFTHAMSRLQPGMPVHVQGPYGGFVMNPLDNKRIVMLAGGIGITPFMSMVRYAADTHSNCDIHLLYSAANQDDVPFAAELLELERQNLHFKVHFALGGEQLDHFPVGKATLGRIDPAMIEAQVGSVFGDINTLFYLCGPPPFMRGMMQQLAKRDVSKSRMITEAFSQGPNRQTGKIRDWPFSMYAATALGLSAGSVAVMAVDMSRIIPASSSVTASGSVSDVSGQSQRQADLDSYIRSLPALTSGAPDSSAVTKALAAANEQPTVASTVATATSGTKSTASAGGSVTGGGTSSAPTASTPTSNPTPSPTPTPAPAPTPTPPPTCKTTQSGVTTCK